MMSLGSAAMDRKIAFVRKFRCGDEPAESDYDQDALTPAQRVALVFELTKLAFGLNGRSTGGRLPRHAWPVVKTRSGRRSSP
jgi:hypothetical protein